MSFEESLIRNASPTLANIKVANLYNFKFATKRECDRTISFFNTIMNPKGIYVELLKNKEDFYLVYVYRKMRLSRELENEEIREFLVTMGYAKEGTTEEFINTLKARLAEEKFPHEVGVFLGYPLVDVKSFIKMKGQNCLACGEWKVYHDKDAALCQFCKYKHCKEVYLRTYQKGRSFSDMLVSA